MVVIISILKLTITFCLGMIGKRLGYLWQNFNSRGGLRTMFTICLGSLLFVTLKTGLVWLLNHTTSLPAWAVYAIVAVSIIPAGWIYHSKASFRLTLDRAIFRKYITQAAVFKSTDYVIYNVLVYIFGSGAVVAVPVAGGIVYLLRIFIYFTYVFRPPKADNELPRSKLRGINNF